MGEKRSLYVRILLLIGLSLFFSACNPAHQAEIFVEDQKAKGLLVLGLRPDQKEALLSANSLANIKVINKELGISYVEGLSKGELLNHAPQAIIEDNELIKIRDSRQKQLEQKRTISTLSADPQSFFSGCKIQEKLRMPEVTVLSAEQSNPKHLSTGDKMTLEALIEDSSETTAAWYLMPPAGSALKSHLIENKEVSIEFDMAGAYTLGLLIKRKGFCNFVFKTLNPSSNPSIQGIELNAKVSEQLNQFNFYHLDVVNAQEAQSLVRSQNKIRVAVLDSGVNYNHPSLKDKIWRNTEEVLDGVDNDGNGYVDDIIGYDFLYNDNMPMDDVGHGSHVAGLIAGKEMGVAPDHVEIMPIKVGTEMIDGRALIEGLSYAINKKADIINLSLGSHSPNKIIKYALQQARDQGITVIAASGNGDAFGEGVDVDLVPHFPSGYNLSNIISVGACTEKGELTNYSNYGQKSVDLVAPGGYSTLEQPLEKMLFSAYLPNPQGRILNPSNGTSMAAPIVSGIAALLLAKSPQLSPLAIKGALVSTGVPYEGLKRKSSSGVLVNAQQALVGQQLMF